MPFLFGITLFVSAVLLFWVQPLVGKMLLPLLGGSPAVWNTCMFFFQAMLLAGYGYAHFVTHRLRPRQQIILHVSLLVVAGFFLPIGIPAERVNALSGDGSPFLWLFGTLLITAGLPFFIVSTSAPLLQRWFSLTRHASAGDPYFLYAASNLGSLLVLLAFPAVFEPLMRLGQQSRCWAGVYCLLVVLVGVCAASVWRLRDETVATEIPAARLDGSWRERGRWILLSFVPSSLMLGVTTYLTTDIATIPLLWVVPLALYLLTFVFVFAQRQVLSLAVMARVLPAIAVALVYLKLSKATEPAWVLIFCHVAFFFVAAMVCHGRLATSRPPSSRLTEFYFCMSVGGVLGGMFNAMLAPVIFNDIVEYPLLIVLAAMLYPAAAPAKWSWKELAFPLGVGVVALLLVKFVPGIASIPGGARSLVMFGAPVVACYFLSRSPIRFGLAIGAVLWAGTFHLDQQGKTVYRDRDFFGVSKVTTDAAERFYQIYHGNTIHGRQFIDPSRHCEPLTYYHRAGPLQDVFTEFQRLRPRSEVAIIGLGSGAIAAYSLPGERWTYYEIDPVVVSLARNTNYFTYLTRCAKAPMGIVLGDARLRLREARSAQFNLIVLDAFSSDAIPIHLITREAVSLYCDKLADGGIMAWHISNRFLVLETVVAALAADAGLAAFIRSDLEISAVDQANGKEPSLWVVMARKAADLGDLPQNPAWRQLAASKNSVPWSDDFSNILSVFQWK